MRHEKYSSIEQLIKDREWTRPDSYYGPQYFGFVIAITRTRDSDILDRANFQAMKSLLGRWCSVEGASHWACGWVEYIMVSVTAKATLEKLREALNALADYPVLDDSLFSEMELEEQDETFENNKGEFTREVLKLAYGKDFKPSELVEKLAENVASVIFNEDCSYSGTDWGCVTDDAIVRWAKNQWTEKLEGNEVADKLRAMYSVEAKKLSVVK